MLFILSIFFLVLKILSFILFLLSSNGPAFKIVLIMILIEILYLLTTIGLAKFLKLSELRKDRHNYISRYQIASISDHIWNIGYIIYYICIFIGLILWLRFNNSNHTLNLRDQEIKIKEFLNSNSILNIILSIIIIILLLITYLIIIRKFQIKFGYEIIRLHLYLNYFPKYFDIFFSPGILELSKYTLHNLQSIIFRECIDKLIITRINKYYKTDLRILAYTWEFLLNLHYIILFTLIIKDLFFNEFILKNYFSFLPYFFIYAIWIRFSKAVRNRSYMMDYNLSQMLYGKVIIQDGEIFVDGIFICTLESLSEYIKYLNNGLFNLELQQMDNESKGFIMKFKDKIINKILKIIIIKKLLNYNYRTKLIKIHRINIKIVKIVMILIVICLLVM
jgi:hypothetical protein